MPLYNVHYETPKGLRKRYCIEAINKADASRMFENKVRFDNDDGFFDCKVVKVIELKDRIRTAKQILATHYRACIGSAAMLEKAISSIPFIYKAEEDIRLVRDRGLALQNLAKVKRDIADLFRRFGLKIK
jgi:hypothetical protein